MTQLGFGGDPVQLGRADQGVDGGRTFAAAIGASEQVVAPADGDATQRPLGCRVVDLDGAVVAVAQQGRPQVQGLQDGTGCVGFARELFKRGAQPLLQVVEQRSRARLAYRPALVGRFAADLGLDQIQFGDAAQCLCRQRQWPPRAGRATCGAHAPNMLLRRCRRLHTRRSSRRQHQPAARPGSWPVGFAGG